VEIQKLKNLVDGELAKVGTALKLARNRIHKKLNSAQFNSKVAANKTASNNLKHKTVKNSSANLQQLFGNNSQPSTSKGSIDQSHSNTFDEFEEFGDSDASTSTENDGINTSRNNQNPDSTLGQSKSRDTLKYPRGNEGNVVELLAEFGIFVDKDELKSVLSTSTSLYEITKGLTQIVFTEEALKTCSRTGKHTDKPGLNLQAIRCIKNYTRVWCLQKDFYFDDKKVDQTITAVLSYWNKKGEEPMSTSSFLYI